MKMFGSKKGLTAIGPLALAFGVGIVVTVVIASIVSSVQASQTTGGAAYNVSVKGMEGLNNYSSQFGLVGTIAIFVIVIGLVYMLGLRK